MHETSSVHGNCRHCNSCTPVSLQQDSIHRNQFRLQFPRVTPLIYYARDTWFIKMTAVRDKLVKNNDTVNWIPESIGKGRFGDWLKNVQDWGLSRNRYWGTPLNIWECECGCRHAIGSIEELKSMSDNCPDEIELHRPFIDAVTIKCPECGKQMHRVSEVIDCWFDSGSMLSLARSGI